MVNSDDLLFCEVALRLGKASKSQIEQALCRKADLEAQGLRFRIGEVLASLGVLDRDAVREVLDLQKREVFACPSCNAHFLRGTMKPGTRMKCGKCGNAMSIPVPDAASDSASSPAANAPSSASPTSGDSANRDVETTKRRPARVSRGVLGTRLGISEKADRSERDASPSDPLIGTVLSRCELIERLGVGGWGSVYRSRHQITGKEFAVKVLSANLATNEEMVERFFKEAKLTAHLAHPAIRQIFDAGFEKGHVFMVMEYVDGQSLRALVDLNDPYDPESAVRLTLQVVSGLSMAAEAGITHRDIKPQNILIDQQGRARITDFGLAKASHDSGEITAAGAVLGTPEYMSPEQFEGRPADLRSDMYSLGCTLFFLLTGHPPFAGKDLFTLMQKHRKEAPPSPRRFNARVPMALCRVLERMLAKDAAQRYAKYADLVCDLQSALADGAAQPLPSPDEPAGVVEGSPVHRWMTEERLNQCNVIQGALTELGFLPPAPAELLPRLGIEAEVTQRDHSASGSGFALTCGKCGRKAALSRMLVDNDFACPNCRGGVVNHTGPLELERDLCYVVLRAVGPSLDDVHMAELSLIGEHVTYALGYNLLLDFSRLDPRANVDVNALAAYLQRLIHVPAEVVVETAGGKLRDSLRALGLSEFLRVLPPERTFPDALAGGSLCPHAQEALGLLIGLAGYTEEEFAARAETACRGCPRGDVFQPMYDGLANRVRKGSLDELRAIHVEVTRQLDAPCMKEVADRVYFRAEEGIRAGFEHRGREYLRQGDRARAEKYATMLLRNFPNRASSHDVAGCVALANKLPAEAIKAFTRAIELSEQPREHLLNRATALQAAGDKPGAVRDLDAVIADTAGDFQTLYRRGLLQMDLQNFSEALKDFDRALGITPESPLAHNARGKLRHRLVNLKGAAEDFEEAARLDPLEPTYQANCGALYVKVGDLDKATRHLDRALALQPNLSTPRYNLACIAAKRGDKTRALQLLEEAVARGFNRVELLRSDADLAAVRALPEFAAVLERAESLRPAAGKPSSHG